MIAKTLMQGNFESPVYSVYYTKLFMDNFIVDWNYSFLHAFAASNTIFKEECLFTRCLFE